MTYPDMCVAASINEFYVPVQINVDRSRDLVQQFNVVWTPNINVLDASGNLQYHHEGWLPPSEFAAMLMTAHAHFFIRRKRYQKAEEVFRKVVDRFPLSHFAPEALYYAAVSAYLQSHKGEDLVGGWKVLQAKYPQSSWAVRSSI